MRNTSSIKSDSKLSGKKIALLVGLYICVPTILIFLQTAGVGNFYIMSLAFIALAVIPFFMSFENRKPEARELVILAVLCALAVALRAAFIWVPFFKPMAAIVIIAGIAFGPTSGFMVGALSILASDFIFGVGPWTPWQMFAFGLAGAISGVVGDKGLIPRSDLSGRYKVILSVYGGILVLVIVGLVLDTCTLASTITEINVASALAVYGTGLPVNSIHAFATTVTLLLIGNPLLDKLDRVCVKYGMLR